MRIRVEHNINAARKKLNRIQRKQLPFAIALGLTQTAEFVAANLNNDTRQYLDRPTPFTQRAFTFTRATKSTPVAVVASKKTQEQYLQYVVHGGRRTPPGRAIVIPARIKLNRYGNIPRRAVRRMYSRADTFSGTINGTPGLWQRTKKGLKLLVLYEGKATYRPSFPFEQLSRDYVARAFPVMFDRALRRALRTAR